MEVSYVGKETEQEAKEVKEMPNENEYPSIEDIKDKIKKLKINSSSGQDNIIAELFTIKQNVLDITLHKIIC
jgi:hypothetical protein